jgi:hypothetical protein
MTSSLLVMLAIGITSLAAASTPLAAATLPPEVVVLLLLAAAVRMAAYPLHLWLAPDSIARDRGGQLLLSGGGLVTGAWLLGRLAALGAARWLADPVWIPIFTAAVLAAGVAAWLANRPDRFSLLAAARASWLWLIMAVAPAAISRDALGWALVATVLSLMLLTVGKAIYDHWGWRLPLLLSAITMAGVPLTAGMPAYALAGPTNLITALLWLVGNALALASIFLALRQRDQPASQATTVLAEPPRLNWPVLRLLLALGLCLIPITWWGIQPALLAQAAGFGLIATLPQLLSMFGIMGLISCIAALLLGRSLARLHNTESIMSQTRQAQVSAVFGLGWLRVAGRWLSGWLVNGGRTAIHLLEGESYLGWVILVAVVAWLVFQL